MKKLCFDCTDNKIRQKVYGTFKRESLIEDEWLKLTQYDTKTLCGHWNPKYWEGIKGFKRNWGDASVMSKDFEILRKDDTERGLTTFIILCPKFLRRPLMIESYGNAYGSY